MTNFDNLERKLHAYVAGEMGEQERAKFETMLADDPELSSRTDVQLAIESRMRKTFAFAKPTVSEVESWLTEADVPATTFTAQATSRSRREWLRIGVTVASLAATVAIIAFFAQGRSNRTPEPFFEPVALAQVYRENVDHGFRPYYFCEDEERFAATFRKRQLVGLRLKPTPDDRYMTGLSYTGGLSRETTAMLCLVKEKPVMVFVDRLDTDNESIAVSKPDGLHVHRAELGGLVLYEVSPFDSPMMMQFLAPVE